MEEVGKCGGGIMGKCVGVWGGVGDVRKYEGGVEECMV